MKLSPPQLRKALGQALLPGYLVSGDETLLVQKALDEIRATARRQGFTTRELYVATAGFDWSQLSAAAASLSLFAEKRIIELRLPTGKPGRDGSAAIVELLEHVGDDVLVLIEAPRLDKTSQGAKWVRAVDARGATVQIWPISLRDLPTWIGTAMREAGLQPDREAVRLLAERVEGNLLAADQEVQKLALLLGEGPVSAADIVNSVADSSRFDVYKLVDSAVAGQSARAIRMLGKVRAEGVDAVILVWALTRDLRMLAGLAESLEAGSDLGAAMGKARVWPSRQGIVRACLSRHAAVDFYRLLKTAHRADAAAKGQIPLDAWQLATEIVFGMAAGKAKAA